METNSMKTDIMNMTIQNTKLYIYGLFDPRNLQLRYIGKTNYPNRRLSEHITEAKNTKFYSHKIHWIRQLLSESLEPAIEILEECTEDNWSESEIAWIKEAREKGLKLTNISIGGDRPPSWKGKHHTEEQKQRQSKFMHNYWIKNKHPSKGIPLTEEQKRKTKETKIKNGTWGKNWTEDYTEDEIKEIYCKRDTPQWRENISKANKGRFAGNNNPMYGKKQTEKSNMKNRLSNLMYHANRKNQMDELFELQEQYYEITGHYQEKYPYPL